MEIQPFNNEVALYNERNELIGTLPTLTIVDDDNAAAVAALVKKVDGFCKKVKNERLATTRQLDALKKAFMDKEHDLTDKLLDWKAQALTLTTAYTTRKEAERIAAEKEKARIEAEKTLEAERTAEIASMFGQSAPQPPPPVEVITPPAEKTKINNIRQTKTARFEVVDENKVPRQFLSVDLAKVQKYANDAMHQGIELEALQVDGIRFYTEIKATL